MDAKRRKPGSEEVVERATKRTFAAKTESHERQRLMSSTLEPSSQTEQMVGHSDIGESERDVLELPIQDHKLALDEENDLTEESRMKFRAFEDHERIEAFLMAPAPCPESLLKLREGTPVATWKDFTDVSKITLSVGDTEVELDMSPYVNSVEHSVLFKKDSQMTLEEFHKRYVFRMSNLELFNFDDERMFSMYLPFHVHMKDLNNSLTDDYFDQAFEEPLRPFLKKFIEVDKDRVFNDRLDYLPRIAKSFEESTLRGAASKDVPLRFSSQTSMRFLGLSCDADHSLGCYCRIEVGPRKTNNYNKMAMITPIVVGQGKLPEHKLQTGYTELVDSDGQTSSNATMSTAVRNFKEASDKLISQSIHVNTRKCFITTYEYLFLLELEIDKTTKLLKCRHIMLPTTKTRAVKFYLLSFLMHDKHDWLKDQEFRDHKHLILNPPWGPPEQSEGSKQKTTPSPSASSRTPSSANSGNSEQHDYDNLDSKVCGKSKANYLGYSTERMAKKQKIPTRKYIMSFIWLGNSQVLEVNRDIFAHIEPSNRLIDFCDASSCVLKVIDPAWIDHSLEAPYITDNEEYFSTQYQNAADTICNELKIYQRISDKGLAPRVLAFGILEDPVSFEMGPRFQGPFFILEKIEMHEKSWRDFTEEELRPHFVKIREKFQALWDCNIVHGDIAFRNIVLDKNEDIKLIDFGSSRYTEDPKDFEEESKCLEIELQSGMLY